MDDETGGQHKRRPRYRGTHPRAFGEKYKELNPERYAEDIEKVMARGDTPAGSHRPIMVDEIVQVLRPRPGEIAVDGTLGYGGHTSAILPALLPGGRLYGLDVDPVELPKTEARLRAKGFTPDMLQVRRLNFAALPQLLAEEGLSGVDLFLADLGVSSMQLDNPARGFTFKREGPLDLRMNPEKGQPASEFLATISEEKLAKLLAENADETHAEAIARALVARRGSLNTTTALAAAVREALPAGEEADDAIRRTFQALRIAVNQEFSALDTLLAVLPYCLNPGGRAAILTFHSGEDRRVKRAFQEGLERGLYSEISPTVLRPTPEEQYANPRASSAKLRWAVRA
ncbi:MAG: 16S rRNA (cytosine(1402)-N(4))-methyltransferase RsmH [Armatimonadota bacterium]